MAAASSEFAAALHRRTHRITSALAYAALEWILIALLLIDGLFAYAIARFAAYFGLTPPCLLCSRVDRLFQAEDDGGEAAAARWLRGVLCSAHSAEISGMGYCLRHRRLAEADDMCEGCLPSWKERGNDAEEKGAAVCSCCEAAVQISSRELVEDAKDDEKIAEEEQEHDQGYALLSQEEHQEEEDEQEVENHEQQIELEDQDQQREKEISVEDKSLEVLAQGEEIMPEDDRLVPVVALNEVTAADGSGLHRDTNSEESDSESIDDYEHDMGNLDIGVLLKNKKKRVLASKLAIASGVSVTEDGPVVHIPHSSETLTSPSDPAENSVPENAEAVLEQVGDFTAEEEDIIVPQVTETVTHDGNKAAEAETNCEVSIGSDICERDQDDHVVPFQESVVVTEEPYAPLTFADDWPLPLETLHETAPTEQEANQAKQVEVMTSQRLDYLPNEQIELEEDKAPETPTYSIASQSMDRKFLLERKRSLSLSLDGSIASEIDGNEPFTVDQLKSMLQSERKALSALYTELEEERSAAAIATNQTMAMINRLQEEKAAMQMEALQYQRMMEEQSEYDQEALQLLTDLVTKREREKQELERELELCKQKVLHYEDKERRRMASFKDNVHSPNGNGTSVSSSGEESDEHSDDYCELGESPDRGNRQSTSEAAISLTTDQENTKHLVALDDSLTYFEMERLSILEELKTLEERLFTLEDDDTSNVAAGHSSDDYEQSTEGVHSPENGLGGDKTKFEGRNPISRGKSLLPLFDAVGDDNSDRISSSRVEDAETDNSRKPISVLTKGLERLAIIDEVDHVYERLQALEADKEFLRHCIKSLKKGNKGIYLLQEILQHLRELRDVELHVKNAGDALAANSA